MTKILMFLLMLSPGFALAVDYQTNDQTCYGFPRVAGIQTPPGTCVGLVASKRTVDWSFPRKILFDGDHAYVSAFGGWKKNAGQIYRLDFTPGRVEVIPIARGTDRTHGLRKGPDGRIYFGDATAIYRFDPRNPEHIEPVITNKPDTYRGEGSNHPLAEFIFLNDGSLVLNVGAPTNDCKKEFEAVRSCVQRDEQADLRLYKYDAQTGTFDANFIRIAKGLRNSMGLLFNERAGEIYQAENASDASGTPDELNIIDLNAFDPNAPFDFGWPYCFGNGERYRGYQNYRTFCSARALRPKLLLPAHAAPLDIMYYRGAMFPDLTGKILISYHGHQPSGSRIAVVDTNAEGQPTDFLNYFVDGWQADPAGRFPKGAPVGIAEDASGALFIVDDKNHALLVVATTEERTQDEAGGPWVVRTSENLDQIFTEEQLRDWDGLFNDIFIKTDCKSCHGTVVKNDSPRQTLANVLNQGWLRTETAPGDQTLWNRLTGGNGLRRMPPPGDEPVDGETLSAFKVWLESLM